jgi:hypothetical protein
MRVPGYIRHTYFGKDLPKSVYFFTLHKCASTLFSRHVLDNANDLFKVDYAHQIYRGETKPGKKLRFRDRGFIYGPIRISADETAPVGRMLVKPTTEHEFVRDKTAIFFVRDPRDILVSQYYSFGYTHGLSPVDEIREKQESKRKRIQGLSLDEYVLENVDAQIRDFETIHELAKICEHSVVLKYEDMVEDFERFSEMLCEMISLDRSVVQEIYRRSRPRTEEDTSLHRRSGRVGGFREKLRSDTIESLNRQLQGILAKFGYEVQQGSEHDIGSDQAHSAP